MRKRHIGVLLNRRVATGTCLAIASASIAVDNSRKHTRGPWHQSCVYIVLAPDLRTSRKNWLNLRQFVLGCVASCMKRYNAALWVGDINWSRTWTGMQGSDDRLTRLVG
jgi:hypothetical protein